MKSKVDVKEQTRQVAHSVDATEVVQMLRRLFKAIHEYSKAIHKKSGLSGPQVWALTILEKSPDISARELASLMFVHPSTVTGIIGRLEGKGAITRVVDSRDKRGVRLSMTRAGRRILKSTPPPVQVGLARALTRLPPRRLSELRRSLEKIVRETEADRLSAPFFGFDS
jgi:MarR family transcriptional regulator, organic hydroperoxide resistance regulator